MAKRKSKKIKRGKTLMDGLNEIINDINKPIIINPPPELDNPNTDEPLPKKE